MLRRWCLGSSRFLELWTKCLLGAVSRTVDCKALTLLNAQPAVLCFDAVDPHTTQDSEPAPVVIVSTSRGSRRRQQLLDAAQRDADARACAEEARAAAAAAALAAGPNGSPGRGSMHASPPHSPRSPLPAYALLARPGWPNPALPYTSEEVRACPGYLTTSMS